MTAETLREIYVEAVAECHPRRVLGPALAGVRFERVFLLALGKAAESMAEAAVEVLGSRVVGGIAVGKGSASGEVGRIGMVEVWHGSHPVPDHRSFAAGARLCACLKDFLQVADGVVVLLSGGASSLVEIPKPGVTPEQIMALNRELMRAALPIEEMNRRRRDLSDFKGGGLLKLLPPNNVTFVISDVLDSPLEVVGSGPTAGGDLRWVADGASLLSAAIRVAVRRGYAADTYAWPLRGEASEEGRKMAALEGTSTAASPEHPWTTWVAAGETTVTVRGKGRGGRCQELALGFAIAADGRSPRILLAAGSDGEDGDCEVAGAWADHTTAARARQLGLDPQACLDDNDSYTFFAKLGQHVFTGPSGTNVNDLILFSIL